MKKIPDDLKQMDERIRKLARQEELIKRKPQESPYIYATKTGFRVGTELLAGVLVGAGIGYLLDEYFSMRPLFLIVFLFLGGAAGFLNVYRFVKSEETKKE